MNTTAEKIADPTNDLPAHVLWSSYNLYRYEMGAQGQFIKVVALGQQQGNLPVVGTKPVLLIHGLGSSIRNARFVALAQNLIDNNLADSVFGFEYDTQDSIGNNAQFFRQALNLINPAGTARPQWAFIGHSLGGLVARGAIQTGTLPIAATGNRVITLGTPHLGTPVANAVQDTQDLPSKVAVVNRLNQGGFTNADGNPSQVNLASQGFTDLREGSAFLNNLNGNIANHAQVNYWTIAGNVKGSDYQSMNDLLRVTTDDGFVTIGSATPTALNPFGSMVVPTNHTDLPQDATNVFPLIRQYLVQ